MKLIFQFLKKILDRLEKIVYYISMMKKLITKCPVCGREMRVTTLVCKNCGSELRGNFELCEFCSLDHEELVFLRIFLKSRGNISEVAKKLGISHPTARVRLRDILDKLGYELEPEPEENINEILTKVEKGEMKADEAAELIKKMRR